MQDPIIIKFDLNADDAFMENLHRELRKGYIKIPSNQRIEIINPNQKPIEQLEEELKREALEYAIALLKQSYVNDEEAAQIKVILDHVLQDIFNPNVEGGGTP
ncbi:MAG TPA: hypothetical protein GX728_00845 [Clostridiaceae bacterium]|nr:hypothetical protein [Clostridiaceae bacterium]